MRPSSQQLQALAAALAQVYGKGIPDFDRAQTQLYTPFLRLSIDLGRTEGQSAQGDVYEIGGDFLYVDPDDETRNASIGSVTIELNDKTSADKAPFTANPGFAVNGVFTSIKVRYTNQPGKRLELRYSTGYSVIPSFAALTSISNIVDVLVTNALTIAGTVTQDDAGIGHQTSFTSTATNVAATPQNIVAAASNVNGLSVYMAEAMMVAAALGACSFLSKTTAPASVVDGYVLAQASAGVQANAPTIRMSRRTNIAAGFRLDYITSVNEVGPSMRSVIYDLL